MMCGKLFVGGVVIFALSQSPPVRAAAVLEITFQGQITQAGMQSPLGVGDSFVLVMDFTPGGATSAYGYAVGKGAQISPALLSGFRLPGLPAWDADFASPLEYRMYDYVSLTGGSNVLQFAMFDQDAGVSGSVNLGEALPAGWLSNTSTSPPQNASGAPIAMSGSLYFNYGNSGGFFDLGHITAGNVVELSDEAQPALAAPLPTAIEMGAAALAGLILMRRFRRSRNSD